MRESGILLPIFSLPSRYGIGCFSKEAYEFVDFLARAGQKKWQILPLGPTGYGDSPYQSFSTFAGNPYFIDLVTLSEEGLLTADECDSFDFGVHEECIDYGKLYFNRYELLWLAYQRFEQSEDFVRFVDVNRWWLEDYSLFMSLKNHYGGSSWDTWEVGERNREEVALIKARQNLQKEMDFHFFLQYQFTKQWNALHRYANAKQIEIIGDIPIYVAFDSADAWANPELFQFDEERKPMAVAGCPPDYFSATGQLWGNPLYDWEYHQKTGYEWWFKRLAHTFILYDVVRIDHFRGFDEYYAIPAGAKDAIIGSWEKGPGLGFFEAIKAEFGELPIIAEDLGILTDSVLQLLTDTGFPGMKIIQFAFDSRESNAYLPYTYSRSCVVYTGTHDNDTTLGWYQTVRDETRNFAEEYLHIGGKPDNEIPYYFIKMAMGSPADLCIIPLQDYLCLGNEARINTPSTLGDNWVWRLLPGLLNKEVAENIRAVTALYGRSIDQKAL